MTLDIANRARSWIGTPYHHQFARKGAGCDCLGLIRGIWTELDLPFVPEPAAYSQDWGEVRGDELLWEAARSYLVERPKEQDEVGTVLLFRMRRTAIAKHLGIQTETGPKASFVHAYSGRSVVETALTPHWRNRIVARFAFPIHGAI